MQPSVSGAPSSARTQVKEGERFGRYTLLERIGRGGMAEVFRAVATGVEGFQRVFVVKRILKEKSSSPDFISMFVAEARLSALLNHPSIVQIYDFGQVDGSYFLSMEYLRGKDLLTVMRQLRGSERQMQPAVAAYIAQQVALGLHHAHSLTAAGGQPLGIVHRDVSPSNVMLLRAGGVKLLDFGIAKVGESPAVDKDGTRTGLIKGKLSYLSPEQIAGAEVDARSDIFSLGVVLWEMLTGRRLFHGKTDFETMKNVAERPVIPPSLVRPDSPTALDYVALRALEREPGRRYASARELADELEAYLAEERFAPGAVPRMLDEIFGEDSGMFDAQLPEVSSASLSALSTGEISALKHAGAAAVAGLAQKRPAARDRRTIYLVAVGVLAVAAVAIGVAARPGARDEAQLAPAVTPSPAKMAAAAAPVPTEVSVRFETVPRGAEVVAPDGRTLGTTPALFTLPRGTQPVALTLRKKGFVESRYEVVPDRDLSALITLLVDRSGPPARADQAAAPPPAPAPSAVERPAAAPVPIPVEAKPVPVPLDGDP